MTIQAPRPRRRAAATAAAVLCVAVLTGCTPAPPEELVRPAPLDGLPVTARYELEPVESRQASKAEARAGFAYHLEAVNEWPDLLTPLGTGAFFNEDETTFHVVRLGSTGLGCSSVPAVLEVMGDAGIRITYESDKTSFFCTEVSFVVDEFDVPDDVTEKPVTVELVAETPALLTVSSSAMRTALLETMPNGE